jgi:hypothetical protein
MTIAGVARSLLPPRALVLARCLRRGLPVPRWGNLRRVEPFSTYFGFDRGRPVDRYYLHQFLAACRDDIHGDVLEIQMPAYTREFGRNVRTSHTIDINPAFELTYTCDLSSAGVIPSDAYDCFLLPNTLSELKDLEGCLREALRVIRPGGTILATTAAIGQIGAADYWRHTEAGWRTIAARVWPGCDVTVSSYGNCLAATAAILGLAAEELTAAELEVSDPKFPVLIGLRCRKPLAA